MRIVFVHQRQIEKLIHLLRQHALHTVLKQRNDFIRERRIVRAAVWNQAGLHQAMTIFVLQTFTVQRRATCRCTEQESTRTHVRRLPCTVTNALETEHRIVDVERHHLQVVRRVRRCRRHPRCERTCFRNAFFKHLTCSIFAVVHQLIAINWLILLAQWRVDTDLTEQAFHTERTRFVGDDRHDALADIFVTQSDIQPLNERHGRGDFTLTGRLGQTLERFHRRRFQRLVRLLTTRRQKATQLLTTVQQVLNFRRVLARMEKRQRLFRDHIILDRNVETVAEVQDFVGVHLLRVVRWVQRFTRRAHAVTLDGFRQHNGRTAVRIVDCLVIRGVNLLRIMSTTVQMPNVFIAHVRNKSCSFRIFAEEIFARVFAAKCLTVLIFTIDGFHHQLTQTSGRITCQKRIPTLTPNGLNDIPLCTAELTFELLDNFAIATHRSIETLQVTVHDEDQVIQTFATRNRNCTQRFRFVRFTVAQEAPNLTVGLRHQATAFQILPVTRLINRADRPQTHRHGWELPEVRHQPWMRIRADALTVDFHTEVIDLLFRQTAFEERARINTRRAVTLNTDQVTFVFAIWTMEKMIEPHVIQRRCR